MEEDPEYHIQMQRSLHAYLSRKIRNTKDIEKAFFEGERQRYRKMVEYVDYSLKRGQKWNVKTLEEYKQKIEVQRSIVEMEGKMNLMQIGQYLQRVEEEKAKLEAE